MGRRVLVIILIAVALGVLPLAASACGGDKRVAQANAVEAAEARLLNIGDFSLLPGRATHSLFQAGGAGLVRLTPNKRIRLARRSAGGLTGGRRARSLSAVHWADE